MLPGAVTTGNDILKLIQKTENVFANDGSIRNCKRINRKAILVILVYLKHICCNFDNSGNS